jgi:hypothetical protein
MSAVVQVLGRYRPPLRALLAGALGGGGGVLVLLGSVLPWVSGADAGRVVYGAATSAGRAALGSRAGLAGGDAVVTIAAGVLAAAAASWYLLGRRRRWQRLALLGSGGFALCWGLLDFAQVGDTAGPDGRRLHLSPGIGLLVVLVGAVLVLGAGAAAPRRGRQDLRVAALRAESLWRRGFLAEAVERQQILLRDCRQVLGWDDPGVRSEALFLAQMFVTAGHLDRGVRLTHTAMAGVEQWLAGDPQRLAQLRAEAAGVIAEANARAVPAPTGWRPGR